MVAGGKVDFQRHLVAILCQSRLRLFQMQDSTCLSGHLEDSLIEYDAKIDKLFVTKTICLITQLPFFNAARAILEQVQAATLDEKPPKLPLEAYIYNALFEVSGCIFFAERRGSC